MYPMIDVYVDAMRCYVCRCEELPAGVRRVTLCRQHFEALKDAVPLAGGRVVSDPSGAGKGD